MSTIKEEKERIRQQSSSTTQTPVQESDDQIAGLGADDNLAADGFLIPDLEAAEEAPPAYGDQHDQVTFSQPGYQAGAIITDDGRVNINISTKNSRLNDLLGSSLRKQLTLVAEEAPLPPAYIPPSLGGQPGQTPPPQLNIVIQIVGSRGDVQPFVALGKVLRATYGHRVRIATHPTFQKFVEENDLEFFSIGGDPAELMAFMVKHPGLMPGFDAIKSGEISRRRKGIEEMLLGCWRSCIEAGNGLGPPPRPHKKNEPLDMDSGVPGSDGQDPFVADAIIANPPSFAHIHIAEKLGIPLHMMFTMPWSPTRAFPHPLANIQSSNADDVLTRYLSYTLVEMLTWQGLGDVINRFREKALDLAPLSIIWAPTLLTRLKIPYTYCWSPSLIPKPNDWGNSIDISGFFFLDLASSYTPDAELATFLNDGPPPIYIGFGSIVVDDPNAMTRMIFDAVKQSGVRALVSKGWGGFGADEIGIPEGVFMLGNVPHDWLFQHVSTVVHHGGAGTTAAGIKAGKPTMVVPFFGDQPFWGAMIAKADAGPEPIPYKKLTAEKLAEAIKTCLAPETLEKAKLLGESIREEQGTDIGGKSFHDHLNVDTLRCSVAPSRVAVWLVRKTQVRLSALAATVLLERGILQQSDLKLYHPVDYNTEDQPPDPISACTSSLVMDISSLSMSIADLPREMFRTRARQKSSQSLQAKSTDATESSKSPGASSSNISGLETDGSTAKPRDLAEREPSQKPSAQQIASSTEAAKPERASSSSSQQDPSAGGNMNLETAIAAGKGVGQIVGVGARTPMNFCLSLAKGFRNAPKLYNDDTVRPAEKVKGFGSGLKIAGKELGFGFYDGITGLVTQPLRGAEKEGASGLIKGFGKGIGGLLVKPAAGIYGIPAYMMQGVHVEVTKRFASSVENYVVTSRIVQGRQDLQKASEAEQDDVAARWSQLRGKLEAFEKARGKKKGKGKELRKQESASTPPPASTLSPASPPLSEPRTGWKHTRNLSFEARKKLHSDKESWKRSQESSQTEQPRSNDQHTTPVVNPQEDAEFEEAIRASVKETSTGNEKEDAAIEAAIRESVNAARAQGDIVDSKSKSDADNSQATEDDEYAITDEEYQQLINQAIQESLGNTGTSSTYEHQNDEELKRALEESQNPPALPSRVDAEQEEEFQRAIAASREESEKQSSARNDEDVVMEYIKKQSLAEEDYRKQHNKGKGRESGDDWNVEDLKKGMEESLKGPNGSNNGGPA